jgi:hypothetical protein
MCSGLGGGDPGVTTGGTDNPRQFRIGKGLLKSGQEPYWGIGRLKRVVHDDSLANRASKAAYEKLMISVIVAYLAAGNCLVQLRSIIEIK